MIYKSVSSSFETSSDVLVLHPKTQLLLVEQIKSWKTWNSVFLYNFGLFQA